MDTSSIAIFAGALVLSAGTPGPSIAALVSRVLTNGWRDVLPFLLAMWLGEVIWLTMALGGLTVLAQTFQFGFMVLKWLGVAYLVWLAIKMWRQPSETDGATLPRQTSALSMFGAGMAVTLGNPKIMVFYVALLPTLVDVTSIGLSQWAVLAGVTLLILAGIDLTWTFLAHQARAFLRKPAAVRIANRVSACTLAGAAAVIATRD